MASAVSISDDENGQPLTPIERMILDYLLKKQARADAAAELKATCSGVKAENAAEAPRSNLTSSNNRKSQVSSNLQEKSASSSSTIKEKQLPTQEKVVDAKWDAFMDDLSDGPLDDEQMDRLMGEFNFSAEMDESEDEEWSLEDEMVPSRASTPARGRGGGQGSKTGRGGRGIPAPSWSDIDEESSGAEGEHGDGDGDDMDDPNEIDENDPVLKGATLMENMSDVQLVEYMGQYKKEKHLGDKADIISNEFFTWLACKFQPNVIASNWPLPATIQGKKVVFEQEPPKRGGGPRGGRRGGR